MNRAVAHGVPGTTFSNIFEKGDYNPAKHAVVPKAIPAKKAVSAKKIGQPKTKTSVNPAP
jgi:hypothetical protein